MRERVFAILTVLAGLALFGATFAGTALEEAKALGDCVVDGAVIRYELARTAEDLAHVFGAADNACRPLRVAAMDALNRGDLYLFVPAYTAFVVFAGLFLARGRVTPLAVGATALALLACGLDVMETLGLLRASPAHAPSEAQMAQIWWFATGKFVALTLNALLLAGLALSKHAIARWIVAGLLCLPVLGVAAMYVDLQFISAQTLTFSVAWLGVLALAVGGVFRAGEARA